jgi:outer membrane protein TolC
MKSMALLTCLALIGCHVDESAEVARYRAVLDQGLEDTELLQPGLPLGARDAMRLSNAHNESLSIEGENYLRAIIDRRRIAGDWLPRIELSPSYFLRDDARGTESGVDVPLSARLDVNPKGSAADRARADAEIERARAQLYGVQDALLIDVARTLFAVARSERSAVVLQSSLDVQMARVDDVRARADVGFARPLDVSLTESSASSARVALISAESNARTGRSLLSFLTGIPLDTTALDSSLDVPHEVPEVAELVEEALERRPEVRAATFAVEAAAHDVELASAQWWPSLAVDLEYFLHRDSEPTEQDWRSFFEIRLPLFDGGRIYADVRDALSRLREAKLALSLIRRSVKRDVEIAFENLQASRERVAQLRVQLASASEAFAQANGLYDAGLATNLERLTAQDDQLVTELQLESAELERRVFYLDLLRTVGALHEWVGLERYPEALRAEEGHAEAR